MISYASSSNFPVLDNDTLPSGSLKLLTPDDANDLQRLYDQRNDYALAQGARSIPLPSSKKTTCPPFLAKQGFQETHKTPPKTHLKERMQGYHCCRSISP